MIRHIVMFNAENPEDEDTIFEGLKALETIPGNWKLEVRRNLKTDRLGNDIDVVVYGEFADEAALKEYKSHPIYAETIKVVRPLRDLRIAADIEI